MFTDEEYFKCAKTVLKEYGFMNARKLTKIVNKRLGTDINSYTLARYIKLYNDGSIQKKGKASWEYVGE